MNNKRKLILSSLILSTLPISNFSFAQSVITKDTKVTQQKSLTEGKEYVVVKFEQSKQMEILKEMMGEKELQEALNKKQDIIIEFFWYGCPHCFTMEKSVKEFKDKNKNVKLVQYPVSFPRWISGTELFFAMKNLNLLEKYHDSVFNIIHVNGINILDNQIARKSFFERNANIMIADQIEKELKSDRVKKQVEISKKAIELFQVKSTPLFSIQDFNKNTAKALGPGSSGGYQQTIDNINYLLKK